MKRYISSTLSYIFKLESKIAFYPSVLSLVGLLFAFIMFYLESKGISKYLLENAPVLVVNDTETARNLLTTFIAGLISIMVFSFSMVMILLNQASSNFSPRILPGLISNRRHQIILGVYNFTLLYCIFTLVSIEPDGNKYQLPGFSVLLAIFAMTCCLAAFIYFIHSISQEIQVNNIMDRIFETAKCRLQILIESQSNTDFEDTSDWNVIYSNTSGYFQDLNINALKDISHSKNFKLEIMPIKGRYVLKGLPLAKSSEKLDDDVIEEVCSAFHFSRSELVEDNYLLAFKQISEIAVKAMSPGINDPGTAINAIDYLTELFAIRLQKYDTNIVCDSDEVPVLKINSVDFKDLLFQVMAALRTYCKHDVIIVQKLVLMLNFLKTREEFKIESYKTAIEQELNNLVEDATESLKNEADIKLVKQMLIHT
ncbi:DUF2254 domain-containing protein [Psychroserpens algicola]|uniref:DUF2254 domain-containing protein n=1 Tax=Psychroserpens algicola TaxID=1719034 RepID=A0ABT0H4Q8_9FLAO|nr:DUF2254 domain-containing protein [Psychroserpens algicola]MCK8479384.1 DUF2254 domain-containing protein [Psychroserpens algicola]